MINLIVVTQGVAVVVSSTREREQLVARRPAGKRLSVGALTQQTRPVKGSVAAS